MMNYKRSEIVFTAMVSVVSKAMYHRTSVKPYSMLYEPFRSTDFDH